MVGHPPRRSLGPASKVSEHRLLHLAHRQYPKASMRASVDVVSPQFGGDRAPQSMRGRLPPCSRA